MKDKNNVDKDIDDLDDDCTLYGEFVSSYFAWLPLEKQKIRSKELGRMTKRKKE